MAKVIVGDVTGTADITVGDGSLVGTTANLHELRSTTTQFVAELSRRIQDTSFQTATLGATFQSPTIALDAKRSLVIKAGVSSTITRYTAKDKALLGTDSSEDRYRQQRLLAIVRAPVYRRGGRNGDSGLRFRSVPEVRQRGETDGLHTVFGKRGTAADARRGDRCNPHQLRLIGFVGGSPQTEAGNGAVRRCSG